MTVTGEPTHYALAADSGNAVESYFCPICGSPLYKTSSGHPDLIFFHASARAAFTGKIRIVP